MNSLQLIFLCIVNFLHIQQIQSRELIDSKEPKIIGGLPASIEDEKHFVSIRMIAREETEGFGAGHRCGGTLINEKIVITAAHCLFTTRFGQLIPISEKDLSVALGTTYLKLRDENTVVRSVIKIIRHAQYNDSITTNDIGLLLLNDTAIVKGNPNTGVMKLTNKSPEVGEECRISGFGHQTWQGEISEQLMYADVISISTARCNGTSSYDGQVLDGMICAGFMSGGKDSCAGDSGGPLICDGALHGITSWGEGCGIRNFPGVYTDIAYFLEWIETNINDLLSSLQTSTVASTTVTGESEGSTPTLPSSPEVPISPTEEPPNNDAHQLFYRISSIVAIFISISLTMSF